MTRISKQTNRYSIFFMRHFILVLLAALIFASACQSEPTLYLPQNNDEESETGAEGVVSAGATTTNVPQLTVSRTATSYPSPAVQSTILVESPTPILSPTPGPDATPTTEPVTILLFTGIIVPGRCVQAAIDASGDPDAIYDEVRELIKSADIAIGTLNATIGDYAPHTGCISTYVLVGGSENADAMSRAGFDVMNVATNHIKNCGLTTCGDRAFFETLDNLNRVGIVPVGAGNNTEEAMLPVVVNNKGIRFGFVAQGQIESMAFAGEDQPGIAVLNQENLEIAISEARKVSDVVVVMPHWGPEDVPTPNGIQLRLAQDAVAAGADLVVGNHTHVVQAIQKIDGVYVFYGLGNFIFDQTWALDHQQGVILLVKFVGTKLVDYELIPTHVDGDGVVYLADEQEADQILARIEQVSERFK